MASIIRIKRSSGTNKPSSLNWGELAYVTGIGSYGGTNQYKDRIFAGDDGNNVNPVGGYYYTSMMEHQPGTISGVSNTRNSDGGIVAVLDSNRKVDQWNVDNLRLDLNTLSSTNTDGNIIVDPTGIGSVIIPDDTYLSFGDDKNVAMRYDEATDDRFEIEGADWAFANGVAINIGDVTESTTKDNGALVVEGGVGIEKNLNVGGRIDVIGITSVSNTTQSTTKDNGALIVEGGVGIEKNLNVGGSFTLTGISTFTGLIDANGGAYIDNIQIGITNDNTIDTTTGGLTIDSFDGTVTISDQLVISGITSISNTTESTTKDNGALVIEGGVGIEKNLNVGGTINIQGYAIFDQVKIENNVISTISGTELYLDPYPDGLSNDGTVIVKGNLQVDGTTTSINSTTVDINDAIIVLGDITSVRTVMTTVIAGVSTIRLDSVIGINTGDILSGSAALSISGVNTITAYNTVSNVVTLTNATISPGISTTTQLTITHAYDTNTDRGIGFNYNTSSGTSNNKIGFFGFDDSSIADSTVTTLTNGTHADDSRRWTYVPDASITNSLVSGTKGFLDVKGIYYQSGNFSTNGIVFFDDAGLQRSTNDPSSPTITSKQVLTAITKITITLLSAITVSTGDIIRQDTTDAYGVVESGGTISSVSLIGVEGTFTNTYNIRKEGNGGSIQNLSIVPSTVTTIYTNKPTWTSTLDGGTF